MNTDHVVILMVHQQIKCMHCGATAPLPFGLVEDFVSMCRVFVENHAACQANPLYTPPETTGENA